ncbi:hypothetical protein ACIQXV_29405 [Neobacillus sp. NPDC097160]|uniref:hypothetical protein n=1 Tax=Neobacillus sp. NPDC097160 TaxID=3364298 RepID=UPI0037F61059
MQKQESKESNKDFMTPFDYKENIVSNSEKKKQKKIQRQLVQLNRSRGRSPGKKYGY